MPALEWSETLKRKIRVGAVPELTVPNWTLVGNAISSGDRLQALELLDYTRGRCEESYLRFAQMIDQLLTVIAGNLGEEAIEKFWRARYAPRAVDFMRTADTTEHFLKRMTEVQIDHHSRISVIEESDRYVLRADPCGSGGMLRRSTAAGKLKRAYPWTWSRAGIPYYCSHCATVMEILPIEMRGSPLLVVEFNDDPRAPCVHYFYKRPELIPEKYFARVGMKKDPSRFK